MSLISRQHLKSFIYLAVIASCCDVLRAMGLELGAHEMAAIADTLSASIGRPTTAQIVIVILGVMGSNVKAKANIADRRSRKARRLGGKFRLCTRQSAAEPMVPFLRPNFSSRL